jgi:imidazole glycerol phosphate synthase subunit HisF
VIRKIHIAVLVSSMACFLTWSQLKAAFAPEETTTHVYIGDDYFGTFSSITGIDGSQRRMNASGEAYHIITFHRDFISAQSLYQWAREKSEQKANAADIRLIQMTKSGQIQTELTLSQCQPLTWAVATPQTLLGGFNETVEFAAKNITLR